jgi:hypothetical protein
MDLKSLMVDEDAVADRLVKVRAEHPEIKILDYFAVTTSPDGSVRSIRLRRAADTSFDENMLIGYMREMRNNPDPAIVNLYNDIVKVGIAQGSYRTPNSFKHIIPLEDYAKLVAPIMQNVVVDEDIRNFQKSGWFQRNYFNDPDVAVVHYPTFWGGKKNAAGKIVSLSPGEEYVILGEDEEGEPIYQYFSPNILVKDEIGAMYDRRDLLRVNINSRGAGSPIVTVPRIIPATGSRDYAVDFKTGLGVPPARYTDLKQKLGDKINEVYGYELVTVDGNPLYTSDEKGNSYYIYKAVNLYGYPGMSVEYNLFPDKSVFDNNTRKVDAELSNRDIIREYGDIAQIDEIELDDMNLGTDNWTEEDNTSENPFEC